MDDDITLLSRFNRIAAVLVWALSALIVGSALAAAGGAQVLALYPLGLLLAVFGWAGLWRPYVRVGDAGVTLRNVTHTVLVPWEALVHVETRYALTLRTPSGAFSAWAAPAPGLVGSLTARRRHGDRESRASGEALRAGDLIGTESGDAALVVREQWRRRLDAGAVATGVAGDVVVERRWDVPVLAAFTLLTFGAVGALAATS